MRPFFVGGGWWCGGGSADDEAGGDEEFALEVGAAGVFCLLAESFKGGVREVGAGEADGGQRGQGEFGEVNVVEADDGEVMGDAEAFHVCGAQDADGGHVVGADDGRGARGEGLQLAVAGDASFEGVVALDDPLFLEGEAGGLDGGAEVVFAGDGGMEFVGAGKERRSCYGRA